MITENHLVNLPVLFYSILFGILTVPSARADIIQSAFHAEGYEEKIMSEKQTISVKASVAEGLSQLGGKTLYHSRIDIKDEKLNIKLTADEALFKPPEIFAKGRASFVFTDGKSHKDIFKITASLPEDIIYFNIQESSVTSPAAKLRLGSNSYRGRALAVSLHKRQIIWVQSVTDESGKKFKTPLELKF